MTKILNQNIGLIKEGFANQRMKMKIDYLLNQFGFLPFRYKILLLMVLRL